MGALSLAGLSNQSPQEIVNQAVPQPGQGKASAKEAARMFEGMLMTQLFQAMRKTVPQSELFGQNSQAQNTYEYLLDQAVMEHAVTSGKGWGLSDRLEEAWSKNKASEKPKVETGT